MILKETYNKINAITFVREQAAGATTKQEAFGETSPGKFSVRTVILVMVLVVVHAGRLEPVFQAQSRNGGKSGSTFTRSNNTSRKSNNVSA